MAIAVGSVSNTPALATRTNSTITAPTGIANGDLLVAVLHVGDSSALPALTVTPPAGWTEVTNSPSASDKPDPYTIAIHVFHKVASGESGNYTFSHTSAETEGYMYRLTGADTTTPIDATPAAQQFSGTNGQTTGYDSVTPVTNGAFLIFAESDWDGPGAGAVSGSTPTISVRRAGSISWIGDGTQTTAGATGARTRTNGNTHTSLTRWASIVVPIRPATGGSGITGSASITEAGDSVSSASALAIKGTATATEASDTVSASGAIALKGAVSATEASDTVSSAAKVAIAGSLAATEAADTVTASGTGASFNAGSADITEASDTAAATGTLSITATASIVEAGDTAQVTGSVPLPQPVAYERTAFVSAQSRSVTVAAEYRTAHTGPEQRMVAVAPERRRLAA